MPKIELPEYKSKYEGDFDYLICSVRKASDREKEMIQEYIKDFRSQGTQIHYPAEDTNQEDPTGGYRICRDHSREIHNARAIRVIWNPDSTGSYVDLGAALYEQEIQSKRIQIINRRTWDKNFPLINAISNRFNPDFRSMTNSDNIEINWRPPKDHKIDYIGIGIAFMEHFLNNKPIKIANKKEVEQIIAQQKSQDIPKSYEMALLQAHENSRDF
ncbi:hypothetical protein HN832_01260 [archaeon]|jgi:hypothetical protein|nr:hypothetical protein [archaeon]MBT4373901.1 hypothetical protein [archaeon]MBT4532178.1 hypothetical protein [archaeon]MBT7001131.1 hypothetical protein [archaeon]MBT7282020.1 hypothetical protein [archaeon]